MAVALMVSVADVGVAIVLAVAVCVKVVLDVAVLPLWPRLQL